MTGYFGVPEIEDKELDMIRTCVREDELSVTTVTAGTVRANPVTLEDIEQLIKQNKSDHDWSIIFVVVLQFAIAAALWFLIYVSRCA